MNNLAKNIQMRPSVRGPQGEHFSLLTGCESVEELREMIVLLCQACPANQDHLHCPFRTMSGLSYHALTNLVKSLPHESCLKLFEMELNCRSQGEGSCNLTQNPPV